MNLALHWLDYISDRRVWLDASINALTMQFHAGLAVSPRRSCRSTVNLAGAPLK